MGFPLVPTLVTVNDLKQRYGSLWPFFDGFSPKTVGFGVHQVKLAEAIVITVIRLSCSVMFCHVQ